MVSRNMVIAVIASVVIFMGLVLISNMTGNAITASVVGNDVKVENEYFKIGGVEVPINASENLNSTNNSEVENGKG